MLSPQLYISLYACTEFLLYLEAALEQLCCRCNSEFFVVLLSLQQEHLRHQGKIVGICIASNRKGHLLKFKNQKLKILRKKTTDNVFFIYEQPVFVIVSATIDIFLKAMINRTNLPFYSKLLRS